MQNILKDLFLRATDIGMQKHSIQEVADRMKPHDEPVDKSLQEFGLFISEILDDENISLTSNSSGRKNNAAE